MRLSLFVCLFWHRHVQLYFSWFAKHMLTNFTRVQTFGSPNVHSDRLSLDDLTSFAAVAFAPDMACPAGLETRDLPGGLHAVLHFTGPYAGLPASCHWLYGD